MIRFLDFLIEAKFKSVDFYKHNYLISVLTDITTMHKIGVGNKTIDKYIEIDSTTVKKFKNFNITSNIDEFNEISLGNKVPFKWSDINKSKYTGKTAGTDAEFEQVDKLNSIISGNTIKIYDNKNKLVKINGAHKVEGTPKADIALTLDGKEYIWISHKKGNSAKDFQNWGGLSQKELENISNKNAQNYIDNFIVGLKLLFTDINGKQSKIYSVQQQEINDEVCKYAVYGKNISSMQCGRNNVTFLCQGDIELNKKKNNTYSLSATGHFEKNDIIPTGEYYPKFASKVANDRISYGIKGLRIGIYPSVYHKNDPILLDELKLKFKKYKDLANSKTLDQFIKTFLTLSNINDFYHNSGLLNIESIKAYKL